MKDPKPVWPALSLAALTGINLFNYLDRMVLPAVLTPIKEELHLSDGDLGTILIAFMPGYFLTSPLFGYLGDRWPRKWLIAAGVLVWSIGTVSCGWANSLTSFIFFRVLVGLGEASYGTISPGWIADLYPASRRNNKLSIFYVAIPVGSALGYIIGGWLAAHYGWRWAFLCAGAPGLIFALALLALREPARGANDSKEALATASAKGKTGSSYLTLFTIPAYILTVLGYVAQTFALGGFAAWAATFLQRVHGMDLEAATHFFGLSLVITGLSATFLGGFTATAWQKRNPAGYAWVLAISAILAIPAAFGAFLLPDLMLAKTALVSAMFFLFLSTGPVNTLILETVPVTMRASAMAASIFAIHLFGDMWSPKIVGYFSDQWGGLKSAVLVLPFSLIGAAAFWLWLALRTPPRSNASI